MFEFFNRSGNAVEAPSIDKNLIHERMAKALEDAGLDQVIILPSFDPRFRVLERVGQEILPRVDLLVDTSRSMGVDEAKGALLVDLACVLSEAARAAGYQTRVISLGDRVEAIERERLLREGLELEGAMRLTHLLPEAGALLRPGALRILLSDFHFPHDAGSLVRALRPGPGGGTGDAVEGLGDARLQIAAGFGQAYLAHPTHEQPLAHVPLQQLDLMADGGRRDPKLLGGALEALVAGRRLEGAQGVER